MRLLGTFTVAATLLLVAPTTTTTESPATSNCPAPTVKFRPTRVARGATVTITGSNFGDCLSSGTVPAPGPLGSPLVGLDISIVQDTNEVVVATGSADDDYSFKVEVVVPADLEPGEATLNVLAGDARMVISPSLVISSAQPGSAPAVVAPFGPQPTTDTTPAATVPAPILPGDIPDESVTTLPTLSTAPVEFDDDNTDHQRRVITVGFAVFVAVGAVGFALWSRWQRRRW